MMTRVLVHRIAMRFIVSRRSFVFTRNQLNPWPRRLRRFTVSLCWCVLYAPMTPLADAFPCSINTLQLFPTACYLLVSCANAGVQRTSASRSRSILILHLPLSISSSTSPSRSSNATNAWSSGNSSSSTSARAAMATLNH